MPHTSIVIRCYNEEKHIGRLLSGILEQTVDDIQIVVVDSGSTDATVSIASRYPVELISIDPDRFSFGRALNLGCEAAAGEFVVAASAHVYPVYRDWLENLLLPFEHPRVGLVYGKQRGNDVTKYSEHQIFARWFPERSSRSQSHPFCNNANAAIRRELWERLPYDETLTGLEDVDWAKRAMALGYEIAYSAEAEIVHVHDETYRHIYNRYRREAIALRRIFPDQGFSFWEFLRLYAANVVSDYYHAWRDRALRSALLEIPAFRFAQFWGTYRGFRQQGPVTNEVKKRFYYPNGRRRALPRSGDEEARNRIEYGRARRKERPGVVD